MNAYQLFYHVFYYIKDALVEGIFVVLFAIAFRKMWSNEPATAFTFRSLNSFSFPD